MEKDQGIRKISEERLEEMTVLSLVKIALGSLRDLEAVLTEMDPMRVFPNGTIGTAEYEMSVDTLREIINDATTDLDQVVYAFKTNNYEVEEAPGSAFFTDDAYQDETVVVEQPSEEEELPEEEGMDELEEDMNAPDEMGEMLTNLPVEDDVDFQF